MYSHAQNPENVAQHPPPPPKKKRIAQSDATQPSYAARPTAAKIVAPLAALFGSTLCPPQPSTRPSQVSWANQAATRERSPSSFKSRGSAVLGRTRAASRDFRWSSCRRVDSPTDCGPLLCTHMMVNDAARRARAPSSTQTPEPHPKLDRSTAGSATRATPYSAWRTSELAFSERADPTVRWSLNDRASVNAMANAPTTAP